MSRQLQRYLEELRQGIHPDLPPGVDPFWEDGVNVVFDPEGVRPIYGSLKLADGLTTMPPRGMVQALVSGTKTVWWGTKDALYRYPDGGPVADRSKAGGYSGTVESPATVWSFAPWGAWMVASNGIDPVQIDKGSGFADLSTGGVVNKAEIVIALRNFMLAFNVNGNDRQIRWSDKDDVETWSIALANQAGELTARDMSSEIKAAEIHGRGILFYGIDEMHALNYIGPQLVFGQKFVLGGIGALSKQSVVSVRGQHYGIGEQGIWRTDGQDYEYIDSPSVQDFLKEEMSDDHKDKTCVWYDDVQELVHFNYVKDGESEPTSGLCYNVRNGTWSPVGYGGTAGASGKVFNKPIIASSNGVISTAAVEEGTAVNPGTGQKYVNMDDEGIVKNDYGLFGYGEGSYGGDTTVTNG